MPKCAIARWCERGTKRHSVVPLERRATTPTKANYHEINCSARCALVMCSCMRKIALVHSPKHQRVSPNRNSAIVIAQGLCSIRRLGSQVVATGTNLKRKEAKPLGCSCYHSVSLHRRKCIRFLMDAFASPQSATNSWRQLHRQRHGNFQDTWKRSQCSSNSFCFMI